MSKYIYDVIIVGAGPAGCSAAICLASSGLKIALIDKDFFPREKVCGDAISFDSLKQIAKISPTLSLRIENEKSKTATKGILMSFPNNYQHYFNIENKFKNYIIKREIFDNILMEECKSLSNISVFEGTKAKQCIINNNEVHLNCSIKEFYGKIIIGADGVNSIVSKAINKNKNPKLKYALCVRSYFKNVTNTEFNNIIEMHFLKQMNPGYLWIFDMHDGIKNVGFGIDERFVKEHNINMQKILDDTLYKNVKFSNRFKYSEMLEKPKAFRIPIYHSLKKIYDNRILLIGDAAHLVNPWSGEGVSNAIRTGRFAAEQVLKCFEANDFSKNFNKTYYKKIKRKMVPELKKQAFARSLNNYPQFLKFALNLTFK